MTEVVHVRRAVTEDDLAKVADMWSRSADRLHRLGYDQWSYPVKWENIRKSVGERNLWLVTTPQRDVVVGTLTVEEAAEPYWIASDNPEHALYAHRLVVDDGYRGSELGSALLDWAARRARQAGKPWLRLDAWKSNTGLHQYYLDRGFTFVRIDDDPNELSGACFQRASNIELGRGPEVIEDTDNDTE